MTKAEKSHLDKVQRLGCIACMRIGHYGTPAEIHHIRAGQGMSQRADTKSVLPLCPPHHRTGGYGVAYQAGREAWEKTFGTETQLLEKVRGML